MAASSTWADWAMNLGLAFKADSFEGRAEKERGYSLRSLRRHDPDQVPRVSLTGKTCPSRTPAMLLKVYAPRGSAALACGQLEQRLAERGDGLGPPEKPPAPLGDRLRQLRPQVRL